MLAVWLKSSAGWNWAELVFLTVGVLDPPLCSDAGWLPQAGHATRATIQTILQAIPVQWVTWNRRKMQEDKRNKLLCLPPLPKHKCLNERLQRRSERNQQTFSTPKLRLIKRNTTTWMNLKTNSLKFPLVAQNCTGTHILCTLNK